MNHSFLSRTVCRYTGICAALLLSAACPVMAKYPEFGGPKQFDLLCRGQFERVLDWYIPTPGAGPGGDEPRVRAAHNHLIIDMLSMQYLEEDQYHPAKIPQYKDGFLYLYNDPASLLWTINLNKYTSVFVKRDPDGAIYVEKMKCRLAKFSGFPFVPSTPEEAREMLKKKGSLSRPKEGRVR